MKNKTYVSNTFLLPQLQTKDNTVCSFALLRNKRFQRSLDALGPCINTCWFAFIRPTHVTIARFKNVYDTSQKQLLFLAIVIYFLDEEQGVNDRVAIVYYPDDVRHKRAILALEKSLQRVDVDAVALGDTDRGDMRGNWIDSGEKVVHNFSKILIIDSPMLVRICTRNADLTETTHRFPAVVLDSIRGTFAWEVKHRPAVWIGKFYKVDERYEREDSQLQNDHPGVFKHNMKRIKINENTMEITNITKIGRALRL